MTAIARAMEVPSSRRRRESPSQSCREGQQERRARGVQADEGRRPQERGPVAAPVPNTDDEQRAGDQRDAHERRENRRHVLGEGRQRRERVREWRRIDVCRLLAEARVVLLDVRRIAPEHSFGRGQVCAAEVVRERVVRVARGEEERRAHDRYDGQQEHGCSGCRGTGPSQPAHAARRHCSPPGRRESAW